LSHNHEDAKITKNTKKFSFLFVIFVLIVVFVV